MENDNSFESMNTCEDTVIKIEYLQAFRRYVFKNYSGSKKALERLDILIKLYQSGKSKDDIVSANFYVTVDGYDQKLDLSIDPSERKRLLDAVSKGFETLKKYLGEFNERHRTQNKYTAKIDEFCIVLEDNPFFIDNGINNQAAINIFSRDVDLLKETKDFIYEFLSLVKLSLVKPNELNNYNLSNLKWYLNVTILFILSFSVVLSVFIMNVPDIITMNVPEQWQNMLTSLIGFRSYVYNYLGYLLFMYLFSLPYQKLGKANFKTGQFAFANMLPTFILVIIGIPLYFAKITKAPNNFAIYDWIMLLTTVIFLYLHFRTIKSVVKMRGFKFAGMYAVSVIFLFVSMNLVKLIY